MIVPLYKLYEKLYIIIYRSVGYRILQRSYIQHYITLATQQQKLFFTNPF